MIPPPPRTRITTSASGEPSVVVTRTPDNVIGPGRKLCLPRVENRCQVAPLLEEVPHPASLGRVPAVLRTETPDLAVQQGLVQLVLQRCGAERKH